MTRLVVVGGSDAGISAALRARELDASCQVDVLLADAYPNFSICGIPYYASGDLGDWRQLAHRSLADLEATGGLAHEHGRPSSAAAAANERA
jgi:NADPH-dependent 2,4-dienoyl-CoA reductase/sulfur reductase-like enzyme